MCLCQCFQHFVAFKINGGVIDMKFFNNEDGQGLTEYGLLLGLIAVAAVAAFAATGDSIKGLHEMYATTVGDALGSS